MLKNSKLSRNIQIAPLFCVSHPLLFTVVGGTHAEVVLHVAAEIAGRVEVEHVGNLNECQALVAQLAGDVKRCVAVDPEVG